MAAKILYHRLRPSPHLEDAVRRRRAPEPMTVVFGARKNRYSNGLLFASVDLGAGAIEAHARDESELIEAFERAYRLARERSRCARRRSKVSEPRSDLSAAPRR